MVSLKPARLPSPCRSALHAQMVAKAAVDWGQNVRDGQNLTVANSRAFTWKSNHQVDIADNVVWDPTQKWDFTVPMASRPANNTRRLS